VGQFWKAPKRHPANTPLYAELLAGVSSSNDNAGTKSSKALLGFTVIASTTFRADWNARGAANGKDEVDLLNHCRIVRAR
jgi:hypothetical protein